MHGGGWRPQVETLRSRYECLTFDNRGTGRSQPAGVHITVEQMAAETWWLMDRIGWSSAHVVGHSLGGPPPCGPTMPAGRLSLAGIPALVMSAAHDRIGRPACGRALAAAIPGARYVEFVDASHGLPIQHAARVNALLQEHLAQAALPGADPDVA